jgi:hypothetical protein
MKVILVCIAKDEDYYLEEWLDYNKKLGFDEIFLYENNWKCNIKRDFLKISQYSEFPNVPQSYNLFLNQYRKDYDWVAFFDCDEFLVLKKHKNIKDFIKEFDNPYGIGINWKFFGPDSKYNRGEHPNSLLKQFTKSQNGLDRHVKSIINTKSNSFMSLPHNPNTPLLGTNKKFFVGPFNPEGDENVAYLNHYHHKTFDDWLLRVKRGQGDYTPTKTPEEWERDKNVHSEVEDLNAFNFMYI